MPQLAIGCEHGFSASYAIPRFCSAPCCRPAAAVNWRGTRPLVAGLFRLWRRARRYEPIIIEIADDETEEAGARVRRNTMTFAFDAAAELNWHHFVADVRAHEAELARRAAKGVRVPCVLRRRGSDFALRITSLYWEGQARSDHRMTERLLREVLVSVRPRRR
jgi:hypothetical protein